MNHRTPLPDTFEVSLVFLPYFISSRFSSKRTIDEYSLIITENNRLNIRKDVAYINVHTSMLAQ